VQVDSDLGACGGEDNYDAEIDRVHHVRIWGSDELNIIAISSTAATVPVRFFTGITARLIGNQRGLDSILRGVASPPSELNVRISVDSSSNCYLLFLPVRLVPSVQPFLFIGLIFLHART